MFDLVFIQKIVDKKTIINKSSVTGQPDKSSVTG